MSTPARPVTSLSHQLLLRVLAFSLLLTIAATGLNGWLSWRDESSREQAQLQAVLSAYRPGLSKAVWDLDGEAVKAQLSGLQQFPALLWAEVVARQLRESYVKPGADLGQPSAVSRHMLLAPDGQQVIGQLQLRLDRQSLLSAVWQSTRSLVLLVAAELLLQALLLFWLAGRSVSVPLQALSRHVGELTVDRLEDPAPQPAGSRRNELHQLADGITRLQRDLREQLAHRDATARELQCQRDQLNALLERNTRQLDEVLQYMADGAGVIDADGRIVLANPAWAGLMQVAEAPLLRGWPVAQWLRTPDWPSLRAQLQDRDTLAACTLTLKRSDGAELSAEASFSVLERDTAGVARCIQIVLRDLTARLDIERSLISAREAALSGARAKSAFLANMSHEIRTPMNAIMGLTHLMSRDARDSVQRERLGKVDSATRHLLGVINDILDLSKIDADKMHLEDADFSLDDMVSRCFEMVAARASEKGLELVLDTDHLPDRLRGDVTRLSQAVLNLLSNAVKFTESGWVRLKGEVLVEETQRLKVRFEVQDTGEGIPVERQAKLFKAFEQADTSTTRRHGGTGLGLALTGRLAELMGGETGMHSELGRGSSFWFTAWLGRAAQAEPAPAGTIAQRDLRALLVDDLAQARNALGDRLRMLGLQVDALDSGSAAVRRVQEEFANGRPYDVMLIDWRMPAPDGIETLRQLRRLLGDGMPPAILVTAFDGATLRQQVRDVGYDAVLVKPVTASALHDTLVRVQKDRGASLPEPPYVPNQAESAMLNRHAGQRVLLVEDNPINQEVAKELLRSVGLDVETATDGEQAVGLALARHYDLILMDMQMPVMDGLAAARAIRAQAGQATPIVAMTANAFGEDRAACLAAGMNDHVAKPVDPQRLYDTLLRWLPSREATPGR